MLAALKHGFRSAFNFSGKTDRPTFWFWVLANFIVVFGLQLADQFLVNPALNMTSEEAAQSRGLTTIYLLIILLPNVSVAVRRIRDAGYNAWLVLLGLIPVIGTIALIYLFVQPSSHSHSSSVSTS